MLTHCGNNVRNRYSGCVFSVKDIAPVPLKTSRNPALAWNLKAWYGLLMPNRKRGLEIVRMEFRRFLHAIVLLPAQIIRTGRRIVYRLLSWNEWMGDFSAPGNGCDRCRPGSGPSKSAGVKSTGGLSAHTKKRPELTLKHKEYVSK